MLIVRLIHMLAHHPDFQKDVEDLKFFVKYIEFFLDCLGTKDNIAVLFLLAGKIKSIRDSESQGHSEVGALFLTACA
jgi:sister-chromatid-cohesion protein PDS5